MDITAQITECLNLAPRQMPNKAFASGLIAGDGGVGGDEHEHDGEVWNKHRHRMGKKKTLKIHGQTLATWARAVAQEDYQRIKTAISVGLTAGEDNTDIAHRVIGSRRTNGVDGATEVTRQHVYRLGHGLLQKRKSRMAGSSSE